MKYETGGNFQANGTLSGWRKVFVSLDDSDYERLLQHQGKMPDPIGDENPVTIQQLILEHEAEKMLLRTLYRAGCFIDRLEVLQQELVEHNDALTDLYGKLQPA